MTGRPEVSRDVGKSCPAALTEGTRHRRGKGAGRSTVRSAGPFGGEAPAKGRLVEAIGAWPDRTKVKRRKASVAGEVASSTEARYLSEPRGYWRRGGHEVFRILPREVCRVPRER